MSDIAQLKLIQAVDPTKIKVTINQKFSKLTLSSNKKKRNTNLDKEDKNTNAAVIETEKRQSASRNLLESFVDNREVPKAKQTVEYSNPILQSSSSPSELEKGKVELTETLTQLENVYEESKNATTQSMERLMVSDEDENSDNFVLASNGNDVDENELDELTQKVSNLSVDRQELFKQETAAYKTVSYIDLDSSKSDEEEESVICLTDSEDENLPVGPPGPQDEYNLMITSDIATSDKTGELELPCTLSNERADRIEAFLRDVSQECRNIAATGGGLADDSFLAHLPTPTHNIENALKDTFKAKMMAIADTESMKTNTNSMRCSTDSHKQKKIALNDTEEMSTSAEITLLTTQNHVPKNTEALTPLGSQEIAARRFANDETEANTTIGSLSAASFGISEKIHAQKVEAEESIVISETSSEDMSFDNKVSSVHEESIVISETSCEESDLSRVTHKESSPATEQDLVPSEEALSSSVQQSNDYLTQSPAGPSSLGSINISAKINIKLQIRANLTSLGQSSNSSVESRQSSTGDYNGDNGNDDNDKNNKNETEEISNDDELQGNNIGDASDSEPKSQCVGKENYTRLTLQNREPCTPKLKEQTNFMSSAERLLTELYGQSWQTPDVLKTLKRAAKHQEKQDKAAEVKNIVTPKTKDDSHLLDDFSTFRINIEKTNMDSTRLTKKGMLNTKQLRSEPRKPRANKNKTSQNNKFKFPQSEIKRMPKRNQKNEPWRNLIDSDSETEQHVVSDDDHIEETILTDDESEGNEDQQSNASDSSWHELTENEDDDDDKENKSSANSDWEDELNPKTKKLNKTKKTQAKTNAKKKHTKDDYIYMDLTKDEVSIVQKSDSPPANHDEQFRKRLSDLLDSCRHQEKPKLETERSKSKPKRRLFNPNFGDEDNNEDVNDIQAALKDLSFNKDDHDENGAKVKHTGVLLPPSFNVFNKHLESVKTGKPVYKITPPRAKETKTSIVSREETTPFKTPKAIKTPVDKNKCRLNELISTPSFKYNFLKSLDVCVSKSMCHPDALAFRENYRLRKEDLTKILYELFNSKLFDNSLEVPIQWNKKLLNTAGRCLNKKKNGQRLCVIELSDKVLTSADRLRCTLIHELCHAATWVFNGEGGHGQTWKQWARKANTVFPDLPKIGVCHQYDIEYKYTYKCTLCQAKSYYHSKSKKVENIRCSYCYGAIEIFLNKKDKQGNILPTPVKEPTGFAKYVKDNYKQYKRPDTKHAEVMKLLSSEYAALKIADKK